MQEQKEEDKIVAKLKPTAMNLTSTLSEFQGNLMQGQEEIQKPDAASSSQGRLKDAYLGGLKF